MKISGIENYLAKLKVALGDVEVYEALDEYGHKNMDEIDLKNFIQIEKQEALDHSYCNAMIHKCRRTVREFLVIGNH